VAGADRLVLRLMLVIHAGNFRVEMPLLRGAMERR
jgi:hypothetical protein